VVLLGIRYRIESSVEVIGIAVTVFVVETIPRRYRESPATAKRR
jgi:hypothetical protein